MRKSLTQTVMDFVIKTDQDGIKHKRILNVDQDTIIKDKTTNESFKKENVQIQIKLNQKQRIRSQIQTDRERYLKVTR